MSNEFDFNELRVQVLEEIKAGKPLFGKDGAFGPLLEKTMLAEGVADKIIGLLL